jgi:hypothetical protein
MDMLNRNMGDSSAPKTYHHRRNAIILLIVIAIICALLYRGDLGFLGSTWFIFLGGNLTQFWFIALVVITSFYLNIINKFFKQIEEEAKRPNDPLAYDASLNLPTANIPLSSKRNIPHLLSTAIPIICVAAFLIYYFFFHGNTIAMKPNPSIDIECNGGSVFIKTNDTSDTIYLDAGLLTIQSWWHLDANANTFSATGNLCGFTISVPAHTNVKISMNAADVSVDGITGIIKIDSNGGNITVTHSTFLAKSTVDNNGGPITISQSNLLANPTIDNNGGTTTITDSQVPPGFQHG